MYYCDELFSYTAKYDRAVKKNIDLYRVVNQFEQKMNKLERKMNKLEAVLTMFVINVDSHSTNEQIETSEPIETEHQENGDCTPEWATSRSVAELAPEERVDVTRDGVDYEMVSVLVSIVRYIKKLWWGYLWS